MPPGFVRGMSPKPPNRRTASSKMLQPRDPVGTRLVLLPTARCVSKANSPSQRPPTFQALQMLQFLLETPLVESRYESTSPTTTNLVKVCFFMPMGADGSWETRRGKHQPVDIRVRSTRLTATKLRPSTTKVCQWLPTNRHLRGLPSRA